MELEKWLDETRDKKYAFSTLYKKVNESDYSVYSKLKGITGAEKARLLFEEFKKAPTKKKVVVEEPPKEIFYDGLLCSVPSLMYCTGTPNYKYEICNVDVKAKTIGLRDLQRLDNNYVSRYTFHQMNQNIEMASWNIINPSKEFEKRLYPDIGNAVKFKDFIKDPDTSKTGIPQYKINSKDLKFGFAVSQGITYNCQLAVVGNMHGIITSCTHIKEQLYEVYKITRKRIALVDIKDSYIDRFNSVIPKSKIIMHSKYTSTNNSPMNIILINIEKIMEK